MAISFKIRKFSELTTTELYDMLRLRSEVFVVEQNCVYQDIDNKDQIALHVLGYIDDELVAYSRLFRKHDYFSRASIGRVIVAQKYRDKQYGHALVRFSIETVTELFEETTIEISAQKHLENFYSHHGFIPIGEMYLEDNIPHIRMLLSNNS